MFQQRISFPFTLLITIIFFASCKKDIKQDIANNVAPTESPASPASSVTIAQLNQAAYLKAQDYYLWNTQLPATFTGAAFADPAAVMTDLRQYSTEAGFNGPVDRWSFAMKKAEWNQISGGMSTVSSTTANAGDFGITVFFRADGDLRVRMVEPYSPAGAAGIHRGWRILSINGNSTMTITNATFIINNVYYNLTSLFSFQKPDGSIVDITMNAGHYVQKPLYLDTVYNTAVGKAGYMVYNSFLGDIDHSRAEYARVFNKFSQVGISNLIVDLRYNGGGYVDLQANLANYIINSTANGNTMMNQIYNNNHSQENSTTRFQKAGSLNLNKVYFIVSNSTASASELLINNLKPYLDVRLIGPSHTHGKPVGFFPIEDGDWFVFPVSFRTTNRNGEGNYYAGFTPNALVADGLDKDWGDPTESGLSSALQNISSGSFRNRSESSYYESPALAAGNAILDKPMVEVMIDKK